MYKRLIMILLYMLLIFCVIIAEVKYAEHHPLTKDDGVSQPQE